MKKNLNQEQTASALKDMGGFRHPIYVAHAKIDASIYRPNPAPPLAREGLPKITVVKTNGAFFGPVIIGASPEVLFIEAERWVDARAFAVRKLGVSEAVLERFDERPERPIPRWQIRFTGYAGHTKNGMRLQSRFVTSEPTDDRGWSDVRDL